jgi:MFS family permease
MSVGSGASTVRAPGVTHVVMARAVTGDELAALRRPQDHFVRERVLEPDHFTIEVGPFTRWERRLTVDPVPSADGRHQVTATIDFTLAIPVWRPAFTPFIRRNLRRNGGLGRISWWMPPLMDARSTSGLAVLAVFAVVAGYLGVLLSQTNAFFKAEFGATSSEIADAQIAVRIGAFAALAVVALADRRGRRRVVLSSTVAGIILAGTGAFAPNLWAMTLSQGTARVFSAAMLLLITLMAAEEVPAGARASALSILAMAAGLGAGGVVMLLWVGGLSPSAWRLIYLTPLPVLAAVPALARRLPETRRFEVFDLRAGRSARRGPAGPAAAGSGFDLDRATFRRRLVLVGSMLLFFNLFITPWSGFTNDYLLNERGFAAWQLTVFQVVTSLPGGVSIVAGGRLADAYGRRLIGTIGMVGGTVSGVVMYVTDGWLLWTSSTVSVVLGGLLVPSLLVYPTEMFPTGARGRAQGYTNLAAVVGAVVGLKLCGVLADRFSSFGPAITVIAVGPMLVAVIVILWFPETSGRELEELNPGDEPPPTGDELARLDRRWTAHGRAGGPEGDDGRPSPDR